MRAAAPINPQKYARLLTTILPVAIETEEENEPMLAKVSELMDKGEQNLSLEERRLLKLMAILIEDFEERAYPTPEPTPHEMLRFLMQQRDMRQRDLLHIFGSRSVASAVVNGKRSISKAQAKALGAYFHISPEVFL